MILILILMILNQKGAKAKAVGVEIFDISAEQTLFPLAREQTSFSWGLAPEIPRTGMTHPSLLSCSSLLSSCLLYARVLLLGGLHRIVSKGREDRIDTIVAGGGETREGRKERAAIDRRVPEGEAKNAALTADPLARCRS